MMMTSRREFLGAAGLAAGAAHLAGQAKEDKTRDRMSLAAWSLSSSYFRAHRWKNLELPKICREQFGIEGLEFVNQFFENPTLTYLKELKREGEANGVTFVRIMVDEEGGMAAVEAKERREAVIAHRKWIDIAHFLGCQDIRCNVYGSPKDWKQDRDFAQRAAESFHDLLEYSRGSGLAICVENHGGASSDPEMLLSVIKAVNDPRFGTLPDFGNTNRGDDGYEVIRKIVPYAKGVSVKAGWREDGTLPRYDLAKMIQISVEAGFHGWWGIESSFGGRGAQGPAEQAWDNDLKGVRLTKAVLEQTVFKKA
jgi:L-ribulose-5-phosphate 3-epimerase